ncbi:MAG: Gfo/Idh/MocA family oxidoreductase, partial [Xanthomonadaceae bacterium]|nr:Gfo/Idh/MocA family oxidoreductase [Xanthomonadaceae bacterium]
EPLARAAAEKYGIPCWYGDIDAILGDPEIRAVHNCTPNHMHAEVNERVISAGKHIFSEKPLSMSSGESDRMVKLLGERPELVGGVNFCYRMYPLMLEMRDRIAAGEIGKPRLVHGSYLQDWLLYDTDYNWRCERKTAGPSRCVADIGSHWMDLAQNAIGSRIVEVSADFSTAHAIRKKPIKASGTFSKMDMSAGYEEVPIDTEDYAAVLVRFENGARGFYGCSQISAGRKCFIDIEVDGSVASFHWNHEVPDRMWKGNRDAQNEHVMRNPLLTSPCAREYTGLGAGHTEGWNDAFKNGMESFYRFIAAGKRHRDCKCDFATFQEAHWIMKVTEAIIKSSEERRWVKVED